jgi:hypothetical protein
MHVRRVVTVHDANGKAIIVGDGVVEPSNVTLSPTVYHELWRADSHPTLPDAGVNGPKTSFFRPVGGYRFFLLTFPPGDGSSDFEAGISKPVYASFKGSSPASWKAARSSNPACTPPAPSTWRS